MLPSHPNSILGLVHNVYQEWWSRFVKNIRIGLVGQSPVLNVADEAETSSPGLGRRQQMVADII